MPLTWDRRGDRYHVAWAEWSAELVFSRLDPGREGTHARLEGYFANGEKRQLLYRGRTRLDSDITKNQVVKELLAAYDKAHVTEADGTRVEKLIPWKQMLNSACVLVDDAERLGTPPIDIATLHPPLQLPYLVHGLLPENLAAVFYGDGESCKSLFLQLLILACATGETLPYGLKSARRVKVLVLDYETTAEIFVRRIRRLAAGLGIEVPEGWIFYERLYSPLSDNLGNIRDWIYETGAELALVDSLAPATGGELKDTGPALKVMNLLNSLKVTTAVIGHVTKEAGMRGKGQGSIYGSVFFKNLARSTYEVIKGRVTDSSERDFSLYQRKGNEDAWVPDRGFSFRFTEQGGPIALRPRDIATDNDLGAYQARHDRILAALLRFGPQTAEQLAERLNDEKRAVGDELGRLKGKVWEREEGTGARGRVGNPGVWFALDGAPPPRPTLRVLGPGQGDDDDDEWEGSL